MKKSVSSWFRFMAIISLIVGVGIWIVLTRETVAKLNFQLAETMEEVVSVKKEVLELEQDYQSATARSRSLESALAEAKSREASTRSQLAWAQREASAVRKDLEQARAEMKRLEVAHTQLKEAMIAAKAKVPTMDLEQIKAYEAQIASLSDAVDSLQATLSERLGAASVGVTRLETAGVMSPEEDLVSGRKVLILKADLNNGFLVFDWGQAQGLQPGMEFELAKGFAPLIQVKIAYVAPHFSVAYILPGAGELPSLEAGDAVTLLQ